MKLLIASDLHGCARSTEVIVETYLKGDFDTLILLGDLLNHGPRNPVPSGYDPKHAAEILNEVASDIIAVKGNCDSEVDQMLLDFPMSSKQSWVLLPNKRRLLLSHGHIDNPANHPPLRENDCLVFGHTHLPVAEQKNGCFYFNPGSPTFPREGHSPSYGIIDSENLQVMSLGGEVIQQINW